MTTRLAARASNVPLPFGLSSKIFGGGSVGTVAWPGAENWILPGTGPGAATATFNRPERFWLRAGACFIAYNATGTWVRYDYKLRLLVSGAYGNDLNGINFFQKATPNGGGTQWWGNSVEALFFCEANTDYQVYLLSAGGGAANNYYQAQVHWNLWAYTIGEGAV